MHNIQVGLTCLSIQVSTREEGGRERGLAQPSEERAEPKTATLDILAVRDKCLKCREYNVRLIQDSHLWLYKVIVGTTKTILFPGV